MPRGKKQATCDAHKRALVLMPGAGAVRVDPSLLSYQLFAVGSALLALPEGLSPRFWVVWDGTSEETGRIRAEFTQRGRAIPETVGFFGGHDVQGIQVDASRGGMGLYAAQVALHLGFDRVLMVGPVGPETFRAGWQRLAPQLIGKVTALTGWVVELIGKPTRGWLNA